MSDQEPWQVAGDAASTYERALVPALFAAWAPLVVALGAPRPGERILDVACGTGVVARLAAQRVGPTGVVVGLAHALDSYQVGGALTFPIEAHLASATK